MAENYDSKDIVRECASSEGGKKNSSTLTKIKVKHKDKEPTLSCSLLFVS